MSVKNKKIDRTERQKVKRLTIRKIETNRNQKRRRINIRIGNTGNNFRLYYIYLGMMMMTIDQNQEKRIMIGSISMNVLDLVQEIGQRINRGWRRSNLLMI
jgi:hypothetical protein